MAFNFGYYGSGFAPIVPLGVPVAAPLVAAPLGGLDATLNAWNLTPLNVRKEAPPAPAAEEKKEEKKEEAPAPAPAPEPAPPANPNLKLIQEILEASKGAAPGEGLNFADALEFYEFLREKRRRNNLARFF